MDARVADTRCMLRLMWRRESRTNRIFVVGAPRSGTTWVAKMLAATPDTVALIEPDNPKSNPDANASYERYGRVP
ncbi:MAG: sulfotransferase, partial [Chloroflexi bacterium]